MALQKTLFPQIRQGMQYLRQIFSMDESTAGSNISPSNLFFMQPLSCTGHMTDRISAFAVRSLHVFNTLIAPCWMIDKTPGAGGGAGCASKWGSGVLGLIPRKFTSPPAAPISSLPLSLSICPNAQPRMGRPDEIISPWVGRWRKMDGGRGRLQACMPLRQPVVVPHLIVLLFLWSAACVCVFVHVHLVSVCGKEGVGCN